MKLNHSLRQRFIAYILLVSLFLQSCLNAPIPPTIPKHTEPTRTHASATNNNQGKQDSTTHLSDPTSVKKQAMKGQAGLGVSTSTQPQHTALLMDKNLPNPAIVTPSVSQSTRANHAFHQPRSNDGLLSNHPTVKQPSLQPDASDSSKHPNPLTFKKGQPDISVKKLVTRQQIAKERRGSEKEEREVAYEEKPISISEVSAKKTDSILEAHDEISSELMNEIANKVYAIKEDYTVTFDWEGGQCMATVMEISSGGIRKHRLPVCLLPGMTWKQLASMNKSEQPYMLKEVLEKNDQEGHLLVGKMGLMGGGKTTLHDAIEEGDIERVKQLIAAGADKEAKDDYGKTPLHIAVGEGKLEIVQILIAAGANKEAKTDFNKTPLHVAVEGGKAAIAQMLIDAGADKEARNKYGETPLHIAVGGGKLEIVQILIAAGANKETKDGNGYTPLHLAVKKGYIEIVKLLAVKGVDLNLKNGCNDTPLHIAVQEGHIEIIKLLVDAGAQQDVIGRLDGTPLHLAAFYNATEVVQLLLDLGFDKDLKENNGNSPLHWAVLKGSIDTTRALIAAGADLNLKTRNNQLPLHLAIEEGHLQIVKELMISNASSHSQENNKETLLYLAIKWGQVDIVKHLVASGADVNKKNDEGHTPLHLVFVPNRGNLVKVLFPLFDFADTKPQNVTNETAIHTEISVNRGEIFNYLISLGADMNAKDNFGNTPLHTALFWNSEETIKYLMSLGADIHAKNNLGNTPLHMAIHGLRKWEVINHLINSGADIHAKNNLGNTPLHIAISEDNIEELKEFQLDIFKNHCSVFLEFLDEEERNAIKDRFSDEAILRRILKEKVEIAHRLVKRLNVDKNIKNNLGKSPIDIALENSNKELSDQLLNALEGNTHDSDKDSDGNTHLHRAAKRGDVKLLQALIKLDAAINAKNQKQKTALHIAAQKGHQEVTTILLKEKAVTHEKDQKGYTPLHLAAKAGHTEVAVVLVQAGANLHALDSNGLTPVELAAKTGQINLLKQVFQSGADINETGEDGFTHLYRAVQKGDAKLVEILLNLGADSKFRDQDGNSLLHLAAKAGHQEVVVVLIKLGADLHDLNAQQLTPVELAAQANHWDLLKHIFEYIAAIDALGSDGLTHLHRAVKRGNKELVNKLIEFKADVNAKDKSNRTPLHIATKKGNTELAVILVKAKADLHLTDSQGLTPVDQASESKHLDMLKPIFEAGVDLNAVGPDGFTHLHRAAQREDEKLIDKLIELGADIHNKDKDGYTPLQYVIYYKDNKEIVELLITAGAKVDVTDKDGYTPLQYAIFHKDNKDIVVLLIKAKSNLDVTDKDGYTPLHQAISKDKKDIVELLIKAGANLEAKDKEGNTPLHRAVAIENIEFIQTLLSSGADTHAKNQEGLSPLEATSKVNKAEVVQDILQFFDINSRDKDGFSHLYKSWLHGYPGLAQQLIDAGADINSTTEEGWTDLHLAAKHGHVEVAKQLLTVGANTMAKDKRGNIPLHIALQYKQQEVVELLIQQAFDPKATQEQADAFLKEAFKAHHADLVTKVIKSGSYVDGRDKKWMTHFHHAIQQGDVQVAMRLKELGADIHAKNKGGENALHMVMRTDNIQLAKWLIEQGVSYQIRDYAGYTPLYTALKHNQLGLVEQLIKSGMNVDAADNEGCTALHQAIRESDVDMVQRLIALGANVHVADQHGVSPLQMAVQRDQKQLVTLLVQASFSSNKEKQSTPSKRVRKRINKHVNAVYQLMTSQRSSENTQEPSPAAIDRFHKAVKNNDRSLITHLLEAGLSINCRNQNGENALHIAVQAQHSDLALWLIQRGIHTPIRDNSNMSPLYHVVKQGNMKFAKQLLKSGVKLDDAMWIEGSQGFTTLHEAVKKGDIPVVSRLLELGSSVVSKEREPRTMPLHVAAQYGHVAVAQILSQAGADWNQQDTAGLTALQVASKYNQVGFIKQVLQTTVRVNQPNNKGLTHLHQAALLGAVTLVKALLQAGANIHIKDPAGKTAFHYAAQQGNLEIIQELRVQGAKIHEPDQQGWTPLHEAVNHGHLAVVKRLVELGSDLKIKTQDGKQVLHLAAQQGHASIVKWLCDQGCDIHAGDLHAQTSLHIAAAQGHLSTVQELLYYGASVHLQDQQGRTPLHLSAQHGHVTVSTTLVKKGASVITMDHRGLSPMFVAIQQGHFDLVYQSSYAYTYQQHTQHATQRAVHKEDASPNQIPFSELEMSKSTDNKPDQHAIVSFQAFLEDYILMLLPEDLENFTKYILPLLDKHLSTSDVHLQERIIHYLQAGGQLYPGVLANCTVADWIKESLLLDIGREALLQGNEFLFQQLQEQIQILSKHCPTADIEKLLLAIQQKRFIEPLQLDTLLEALQFASVVPMQLASEMLSIIDLNWQFSWKSTWLQRQLPRIGLKNSHRNSLQHALLHLPWSPAMTLRFLEGVQGEKAIAYIDDFLAFVTKYEISESMLIMAMHQPPSYPTLNQLQAWKLYIACELLKNKLASVFPGHVKPLYDKLAFLLRHGCKYESIDELLTHLQAASQASSNNNLVTQQAQHLLEAADLLSEYRPAVNVCERVWGLLKAEKDLSSRNQSIGHSIHQIVVNATFLDAHERSIEEINDYIADKAPGVHFVGDHKVLDDAYQEVEDAYHRSSKLVNFWEPIRDWSRQQVRKWAKKTGGLFGLLAASQAEMVAVVKRAVYLQYGYYPRDTQLMSLLAFLNHADNRGHLLQINTGEGKSLIVAMLAAILALQGKKVDVVTSSTELSIPEVAKQQDFFAMFGLAVGENSKYESKKEVYQKNIVYGTAGDFQGDILRTEFSGDDIRGERRFDVVIVDEVDNLLFDDRSHSVMLSSPTPGMHHLEPVLAAAWSYVGILARHLIEKGGKTFFITEKFKVEGRQIKLFSNTPLEACMFEVKDREAFLQEKTEEHLRKLLRNLSYEERQEREALQSIQERITMLGQEISTLGQETCEQVKAAARQKNDRKELSEIARKAREKREKEQLCERLQKDIAQTDWKKNERDEIIEIPNHLKDFALHQIPYWTRNAIAALWHQKEVHYDVQDGKIVPIDYANTGVLQTNMVWDEGFAQMLQIKEGLRLEPENLSNNFISTIGYFKRYGSSIYGLTGTLGNQHTHRFFKELYDVNMAVIPPYKARPIYGNEGSAYICKELPAIIAPTEKEWIEAIVRTTLHKAKNGRAILVLCQFIEQVKQLEKLLQSQYNKDKIFTYTGQSTFHKHDIHCGEIILATNIAGRGTDFKTSPGVEDNGGMHVCMTFLPTNYRVELQNAGRTAREGKKGTAQLILYEPEKDHSIEYLRARRDLREAKEIKAAMDDVAEMLFRDQLFTKFCALENEFFPSASEQTKIEQSKILASGWEQIVKKALSPESISIAYKAKIAKDMLAKLLEWKKNPSVELSEIVLIGWEEQAKKRLPEIEFKKQYEQKLLDNFCQALKAHIVPDVLVSFQEHKSYTPTHASYAVTNGWGKYERKALEERWGFWFHEMLHQRHSFTKHRILQNFEEFASQIRSDAYAGYLVQNPYFYILKGNDYLRRKDYYRAVNTYNQAINLDPLFSVNARYNKVRALLREKNNKKHHATVQEELERALVLLANTHKPAVLGIHGMTGVGDPKPGLAEYLQHQINILSSQENHIMAALGVVKKVRSKNWEINKIKKKDLKDLTEVFQDEPVSHKHAIDKAETNGFAKLFNITEKEPTPWWSICAVALIGLVQITAGILITTLTGGLGAQLGSKLISDGISDLITAAKAAWSGKFSWAEWGLQKAISWTVTILTVGFSRVCETFKKAAESLGLLNQGYSQGGVGLAMKQVGLELGKTVAKECINGLVDYGLSKFALDDIEKAITERVSVRITKALEKSSFVRQALELDNKQGNNYWQNLLIKEGMKILVQEEHKWLTYFMGVWKGLISSNIKGAAAFFELADASKAIYDLCRYTKNFIKDWSKELERKYQGQLNEKLQEQRKLETAIRQKEELQQKNTIHTTARTIAPRPEVKGGVQVTRLEELEDGFTSEQAEAQELDKVYTAPSNSKVINREFTKVISSKLSNDMRNKLVKPVTSTYVGLTVDRVTREASRSLKESMDEYYQKGHVHELNDQIAEEKGKAAKPSKSSKKTTNDDQKQESERPLDPAVEAQIKQIQEGKEGDLTSLGGISNKAKRPIYVYDENGKLYRIVGKGLPGAPLHVQHIKNENGSGHWQIPGDNSNVIESGDANCLYDACVAQMSPEERAELNAETGKKLRKRVANMLREQPAVARELFQTAEQLRQRNADALMAGGGSSTSKPLAPKNLKNDHKNKTVDGVDWRKVCVKNKKQCKKALSEQRKLTGVIPFDHNTGKPMTLEREYQLAKNSSCHCASCGKGASSPSQASTTGSNKRAGFGLHFSKAPLATSIQDMHDAPWHHPGQALRRMGKPNEFSIYEMQVNAAMKAIRQMRVTQEAEELKEGNVQAEANKRQAEEIRKDEALEQESQQAKHERLRAKKARRRASQKAGRKETARKKVEEQKKAEQEPSKQEAVSTEEKHQEEAKGKEQEESRKKVEEIEKKVQEEAQQKEAEEEAKKQEAARMAKIRKGKEKLPFREESPATTSIENNFFQSVDEVLNNFVQSFQELSPEQEAIQNYSQQAQGLLAQLQREGLSGELEMEIHTLLSKLHNQADEESGKYKIAHQIKRVLVGQEASDIEINQARQTLQQHRENLQRIQALIDKLEHRLRSDVNMEMPGEAGEKQVQEEIDCKEVMEAEKGKKEAREEESTTQTDAKLRRQFEEEERRVRQAEASLLNGEGEVGEEPSLSEENETDEVPLMLENATDEVVAYLEGIKEANFSPEQQKERGKMLLKQVEALKKQEKAAYRLAWRLYIYNSDISETGARILAEDRQVCKVQVKALRDLRTQLKLACKFSQKELAKLGVKLKQNHDEGYETDSSDEEADLSRADIAFRKGAMKGVAKAITSAPGEFIKGFADLLQNPVTTVKGLVTALKQLPELPDALAAYMETIEGNEEAKGEEIAQAIVGQILNFVSPNKVKLLIQLSKTKKLGKAIRIVAGEGEKIEKITRSLKHFLKDRRLPIRGKIRFVPRKADVKNGKILRKDKGFVDKFGNVWKVDKTKNYLEWDVQLSEQGKIKLGRFSRSGNHINVSPNGEITH